MKNEKTITPISGWFGILMMLLCFALGVTGLLLGFALFYLLFAVGLLFLIGLVVVNHNESCVLIKFGHYLGTIKEHGFYWTNPMNNKKSVSLKPHSYTSEHIKVTDNIGNQIIIGLVMEWKVEDTFKATFNVDDYMRYVAFQCDTALIKLAAHYPYDNYNKENPVVTLVAGGDVVNKHLEQELRSRLHVAGIEVVEARLSYVAYATNTGEGKKKKGNNGGKKKDHPHGK